MQTFEYIYLYIKKYEYSNGAMFKSIFSPFDFPCSAEHFPTSDLRYLWTDLETVANQSKSKGLNSQ